MELLWILWGIKNGPTVAIFEFPLLTPLNDYLLPIPEQKLQNWGVKSGILKIAMVNPEQFQVKKIG